MTAPSDPTALVAEWTAAMEGVTPGPWKWWTSCSWRRLSSDARGFDRDGGVICPTVSRSDGHPDLIVSDEDMAWTARCSPAGIAPLLALIAQQAATIEAVSKERDEAQSTTTAWQGVFKAIEAHLQDRVAMNDPASPATYLSIIRSDVANVQRDSRQIVASRWADAARAHAALTAAEAERDRLVAAAETAALRFDFLARDRNSTVVNPAVGAAELRAALSTAKERGE